jgi:hypothetical protein
MPVNPLLVPEIPFSKVQGRLNRLWDPFERNSCMVAFGAQGSGKSHLIRYGVLPLAEQSRIVLIDMKEKSDKVWHGFGKEVDVLPPAFFDTGNEEYRFAWRVVINPATAKSQLRQLFAQLTGEGHCVIVMDETREITEREQLGLGSDVEKLITKTRSLGTSVILGAQSSAWAVSALKDQPAVMWIGSTSGEESALALAKLAGPGRPLLPVVKRIPPRSFLYRDNWDGEVLLALTTPPGR